jgi:nitrate/nitrite-specific signal transduction histidine kinase
VSDWQVVWLALMSIALVVMAGAQVAALLTIARFTRQTSESLQGIRRDLQPVIAKIDRLADEAGKVTALAIIQVERVDRLMALTADRVDEALVLLQDAVVAPLKRGTAMLTAIRAGWALFRGWQDRARPRREDEEALFVG